MEKKWCGSDISASQSASTDVKTEEQYIMERHTTGICFPFVLVSSQLPKHWAITSSYEKPRQRSAPISRYWPGSFGEL